MVVPVHKGGKCSLPGDEAAGPARLPVEGDVSGPRRRELRHVGTVELLSRDVQAKHVSVQSIVVLSIFAAVCVGWAGAALQGSVDDHCGCSKPRKNVSTNIRIIWLPKPVDDLKHTWLGGLRGDKEPNSRGKVEPGRGHQLRLVEEDLWVSKHGSGECSIVVVPTELLGSPPVILLAWRAGKAVGDPGSPLSAVLRPVDLLKVIKSQRLLLEVGEHVGQLSPAGSLAAAHCGKGSDCLEKILVGVGRICFGKYFLEFLWCNNILQYFYIRRVVVTTRVNSFHLGGGQFAGQRSALSDSL